MGQTEYKKTSLRKLALAVGLISPMISGLASAATSSEALVTAKCASCHASTGTGKWDRISESRRTPEGWDMTVARMDYAHGVKLNHDERGAIVKYLSDAYGLSPEESAGHRYIVDRTASVVEHPENKLVGDTCSRCHSYGRIAVQRRTESDWRKLVHFHVGQFPAIEIQAGGRDRNWFEIANGDVARELGKQYGFDSASWSNWKAKKWSSPNGKWRLVGHTPGVGDYEGSAIVEAEGDDRYSVNMTMRYGNGNVEHATGSAIVYTGHEWRATLKQGGREIKHVMTLTADGRELSGRWFESNSDSIGGSMRAVRADQSTAPTVLSVQPSMVKAGVRTRLTINGVGLDGEVSLGAGVKVLKVVERSSDRLVVDVESAKDAVTGPREVKVGALRLADAFTLYQRIDYVKVTPEHPMARVGGGGGAMQKVPAQLEALAFTLGADGKKGTPDDLLLGPVPAAWTLENLNKVAAEMKDLAFAGAITKDGLFQPNQAGPNPQRKYKTNNAGELKVVASVKDGTRTIKATVPLIVTVQRFNDPSIR